MTQLLTPNDVRAKTFETHDTMFGLGRAWYEADAVDDFLDDVAISMTALAKRAQLVGDKQ
jgi:cell division septum initiation protein DivIVA